MKTYKSEEIRSLISLFKVAPIPHQMNLNVDFVSCARNGFIFLNEDGNIGFCFPSTQTLRWCKILQTILPVHTVPVFHNKGKRKYYQLYIPDKNFVANMRDM